MHVVQRVWRVSPIYRRICLRELHQSTCEVENPKRTTKSFVDLPTSHVLTDGTPAKPLGEWRGGLEGLSVDEVTPKPRRLRKKKEQPEVEESDPIVRRTRKKKAPVHLETQQASDEASASAAPRNALATEVMANLARFPKCLLLTRVGQFYESYFEQAPTIASLLNIKSTQRTFSKARVPMCGFPLTHLDRYLKVLVQDHNHSVALCEEFPRPWVDGQPAGFERRVTRIVTPGTLLDESFLDPHENNYLLAIHGALEPSLCFAAEHESVGLAWIDVSTGEFFSRVDRYSAIRDVLVRLSPREVVLDSTFESLPEHPIRQMLLEEGIFISYSSLTPLEESVVLDADLATSSDDLTVIKDTSIHQGDVSEPDVRGGESPQASRPESSAITLLTSFLSSHLMEHMPTLGTPRCEGTDALAGTSRMSLNASTLTALEIKSRSSGSTEGSLVSAVRRTVTAGGTRLLSRWLCAPSTSITEIQARQAIVALFSARTHLRADLRQILRGSSDAPRILQKLAAGRGAASDLANLQATMAMWRSVQARVTLEQEIEDRDHAEVGKDWAALDLLMTRLNKLDVLWNRIEAALQLQGEMDASQSVHTPDTIDDGEAEDLDSAIIQASTKWAIRPDSSPLLKTLHKSLQELLARRINLEHNLQAQLSAPSLTLRSSKQHGFHVHVARSRRDGSKLKDDARFVSIAESRSTCTFFNQEWAQLGGQITEVSSSIMAAEREAFEQLRAEVIAQSMIIRKNARVIDELDVTLGFADLADEAQWVRPELKEEPGYLVENGRHPTVELGLLASGRVFTSNTVGFTGNSTLQIITGPNMGGKSTLLRQTALISLLAQTGSFVPADRAVLGLADQIFARVGARDDLFRGRSTFMVEMLETAEILRSATPRSLVIMDEVGRGTTVSDGLAIAFGTLAHLQRVNKCRTLFATHFHELADILGFDAVSSLAGPAFPGIAFFCTDVQEAEDGFFSYSHRLHPGISRDSHGVKVAQLANMPPLAISMAQAIMGPLKDRPTAIDVQSLLTENQLLNATGSHLS